MSWCVSVLSRVNVYLYHVASSPTIIFAESGFVTRVRLSVWRPVANGSRALGLCDQWGPVLCDSCGPASGHGVEDELVVGCAGLVPASVPSMRVSVDGGRVSEVSSDPVRDRRERGTHGAQSPPARARATMGSVMTGPVTMTRTVSWERPRDVMILWHNRMNRETYWCIVVLWSLTHAHSIINLFSSSWWIQNTDNKAYHLASLRLGFFYVAETAAVYLNLPIILAIVGCWPISRTWWVWSPPGQGITPLTRAENRLSVSLSRSVTAKKVFSQTQQLIRLCCSSVWKNAGK